MLAAFIADAYRRGLTPEFWKIEGTLAPQGAQTIDAAIAANRSCRQIILGKAAELSTIDRWFAACAASATASGFAIGRSVFWEPSAAFLTGTQSASDAAAAICANYLHLVAAWERSRTKKLGTENSELRTQN
jgi:5-dehydro-2-deoxygluconokinase